MAVLMLIGGLELSISGRGLVMMLLTFCPWLAETGGVLLIAYPLLKLDVAFCLAIGCILGAVCPGVLIPILIKLKAGGYGMSKGIPYLIMGAASFDDIAAITGFMICVTFGYNKYIEVPVGIG